MNVNYFASDYWKSYEDFIPAEKAETCTIESYNSRIKHYLARFKRKGKCYSKSDYMIEISLNLLMLKLNNKLTILNQQCPIKILESDSVSLPIRYIVDFIDFDSATFFLLDFKSLIFKDYCM